MILFSLIWFAFFSIGLVLLLIGIYGDYKLKKLKKIGVEIVPTSYSFVPGFMATYSFEKTIRINHFG